MTEDSTTPKKNQLEQLKDYTIVVADTGDIEAIQRLQPQDATTNPSLILKAALMPQYETLIQNAVEYAKGDLNLAMDKVAVNFGTEITKIVPGYVSTEVDARLSFDTDGTIAKARKIIELYKEVGIDKSRILIKIAATWEGIKAAEVLEADGITCNLTLIFSLAQAIACGDANCTLISPFVGRIMDWYKLNTLSKDNQNHYVDNPKEDPGVVSVTEIYNYYKRYGYNTIVMGASFRNVNEILYLVGCDRLTISPNLLDELISATETIQPKLDASQSLIMNDIVKLNMDEKTFRWMMNENPMATDKLAEGIRGFAKDIVTLESIIKKKIEASTEAAAVKENGNATAELDEKKE